MAGLFILLVSAAIGIAVASWVSNYESENDE